ncbi:hypothetical protein KA005_71680, partial [bacterium]|nr:hypothetical protein [bacterium]
SAGLDSRSILAAAGNNCRSIGTYTLGVPGCADQSGAAELAQIAGTRHEFVPIERAYFQSFLQNAEKMCGFTDGLYMPHEFTEIRALDYLQQAKTEILVRGHGGEIAKASLAWPLQVDQHLMELCNAQEIIDCLYEKACFVSTGLKKFCLIKSKSVKTSWKKLFAPVFYQEVKGRSRESLEQSCGSALSLLSPGDLAVYIYIKENIRRHMVTSLQTFRNYTEIRLPFLDFSFLKSILSLDISKRLNPDFHRAVVETYCPAMIKVPDSNTGASLDASPLEEIILEKIHLLLRLVGAKGHRHYTEFQKWLRQQHRDLIAQVIFSKRTLEREYYEPHELKHIFQQHISGQYNHSYLLGTVLGIELWHRQFVD